MKRFLNCKIDISKKVFAPRPETEFWTKLALKEIKKLKEKKIDVLDIFAGSGAIGIAVLKNVKNTSCDFVDVDRSALSQIRINLKINNIKKRRYRIVKSNLFEEINKNSLYDFILANPPYVALNRLSEVQPNVLKKDPRLALFAGKDGLDYIKRLLNEVKNHLKPKGRIYLEFDPQQKPEIKKISGKEGLNLKFRKDQFGKWRFLIGWK
jgi:release factor glutamine methyltransferase